MIAKEIPISLVQDTILPTQNQAQPLDRLRDEIKSLVKAIEALRIIVSKFSFNKYKERFIVSIDELFDEQQSLHIQLELIEIFLRS